MLLGRRDERAVLDRLLEDARAGRSGVLTEDRLREAQRLLEAGLGPGPRAPLEPPHGAVGADGAALEPNHIVTLRELAKCLARRIDVIRMGDIECGSREELGLRVPQEAHERRVHALELAVEADDGQRVRC